VTVRFHDDEVELMHNAIAAFNTLMSRKLREQAEVALLHQAPHRHKTTTANISL
jgi:hypothetical protein